MGQREVRVRDKCVPRSVCHGKVLVVITCHMINKFS